MVFLPGGPTMARTEITLTEQYTQRPRKAPPEGPSYRVNTHKVRSAWFQARESWPLREPPVGLLTRERARAAVEVQPAPGTDQWSPVGPANIGGRMTCVICHPTAAERLWAGAAGGGVWRSVDAGQSWEALWHDEPSLNVGTSWQLLAVADAVGLPHRIGALAVDPFNPDHLLAGGVRHVQGEASGLFVSTDGGVSWARVPFVGSSPYFCHDIRFHPDQQGLIYVTISALGSKNGIWRSRDSGASWEQLGGGLPSPDLIGRTSLALAPSDPDVLYAQIGRKDAVLGVFRSTNGGDTWASIGGSHFANERQMSYNNAIVVHPEDPGWVLCGGVDLHRTTDAGQHWEQVTHWNAERGTPTYAHADHHALVMPTSQPGFVYDLNDGGMDFSTDGGSNWENRSNGLATNMFYDLEVAQTDSRMIAGGAQDNGTLATLDGQADTYFELT